MSPRDSLGSVGDVDGRDRPVRRWIDSSHRPTRPVGAPGRAGAEADADRPLPDRDPGDDPFRRGVDATDRAIGKARHPDRAGADCDADRLGDIDAGNDARWCVGGLVLAAAAAKEGEEEAGGGKDDFHSLQDVQAERMFVGGELGLVSQRGEQPVALVEHRPAGAGEGCRVIEPGGVGAEDVEDVVDEA